MKIIDYDYEKIAQKLQAIAEGRFAKGQRGEYFDLNEAINALRMAVHLQQVVDDLRKALLPLMPPPPPYTPASQDYFVGGSHDEAH